MPYGTVKADSVINSSGTTVDLTVITTDNATTSAAGYMSAADKTKLDGIEASATADQTGAEIKAAYEGEADTNAYDDAAVAKLAGIEANATADQTGAEIKTAYEGEADTNAFTDAEKTKLSGVQAGAQVNSVLTVAGKTGAVSLVKGDVGLGDVDNTSDANKPVSTATQTALDAKADLVGGKLSTSQIPDLAVTEYKGDVADQTAMLAVSGQKGDWVTRQDDGKVYIITGDDPTSASDWTAITYPASAVQSVAGKTGVVTLDVSDVTGAAATSSLATVATSGAYSDLTGTPDITKVEIDSEHEITNGSTAGSGSNLILNGDWATQDSTNWSSGDAGYVENFNQGGFAYLATVTGSGGNGDWQSFTTVSGTTYALSLDTYYGGGYKIIDGNGLSGTVITSATSSDTSGSLDTLTTTFTASSTTTTLSLQIPQSGGTYAFDNASVTEVLSIPTLKLGNITSSDTYASFSEDGGAALYYDNSVKLETTSAGVDVTGSLTATGNVTAYSDVSLKENIEVIPGALEKVAAIRGVTYDRKDIEGARHAGVIAQEVEAVLPEVVMTDAEGLKSVAYGNLVGLLIEAVKELKAEVETLKQERN